MGPILLPLQGELPPLSLLLPISLIPIPLFLLFPTSPHIHISSYLLPIHFLSLSTSPAHAQPIPLSKVVTFPSNILHYTFIITTHT